MYTQKMSSVSQVALPKRGYRRGYKISLKVKKSFIYMVFPDSFNRRQPTNKTCKDTLCVSINTATPHGWRGFSLLLADFATRRVARFWPPHTRFFLSLSLLLADAQTAKSARLRPSKSTNYAWWRPQIFFRASGGIPKTARERIPSSLRRRLCFARTHLGDNIGNMLALGLCRRRWSERWRLACGALACLDGGAVTADTPDDAIAQVLLDHGRVGALRQGTEGKFLKGSR